MKNIYKELEVIEEKLWELEIRVNEGFIKNKLFELGNKLSWLLLKIEERRQEDGKQT